MEDDLRALEREVATHGEPAARLRLARALERAGRRDDAFEVLAPAIDDAEVRRELVRFPAWTHAPGGNAGRTAWIDARPIRSSPRVRWTRRLCERSAFGGSVVASGLGLAVTAIEQLDHEPYLRTSLVAIDPITGGVRWARSIEGERVLRGLALSGDSVVVQESSETTIDHADGGHAHVPVFGPSLVFDLATGAQRSTLPAGELCLVDRDTAFVRTDGRVQAVAFDSPTPRTRWTIDDVDGEWAALGELVVTSGRAGTRAFTRAEGALVWQVEERGRPMADDRELVLDPWSSGPDAERAHISFDGRVSPGGRGKPMALTPTTYLSVTHHDRARTTLRRSGRPGHDDDVESEVGEVWWSGAEGHHACAQDVVYVADDTERVDAFSLGGRHLWRFPLEVPDTIARLAPLSGRLYVYSVEGVLLCIEEGGAPG